MTARTAYGPSRGVAGERAGAMGADMSYDVRSDRVFVPPASIPSEPRRLRRNHSTLRHPFDPSAHGPRPPFHARATLTSPPFTSIDSQTLTALNPAHLKVIPASTTRAIVPAERHTARRPRASSPPAPISRPPKNKISPPTAGAHRRPPVPLFPPTHQALLGQEVVVTLGDASTRTGIVYTVDPVNFSVALLKVGTHAGRRQGCRGRPRLRFDRVFTLKRLLRRRFHRSLPARAFPRRVAPDLRPTPLPFTPAAAPTPHQGHTRYESAQLQTRAPRSRGQPS
jgi:hypothetical protein